MTDRTLVVGVLNVTPDSFSDGGRYVDPQDAVAHGIRLRAEGADLIDVGGESTRPGALPTEVDEELARVLPVVRGLVAADVPVSIDTMHARTAAECVAAGAGVVNDVSGGRADPDMRRTVAGLGVRYVVMHWRGPSDRMTDLAAYDDVVGEVIAELAESVAAALANGVARAAIIVDPGLGFAKDAEHNWALLRGLPDLMALGYPVLVGASRKRFLGSLLGDEDPRAVADRDAATHAVSAIAAMHGVWGVRVHDVLGSADAVRVAAAWRGEGRS